MPKKEIFMENAKTELNGGAVAVLDAEEPSMELQVLIKDVYIAETEKEREGFCLYFSDGKGFRIQISEIV